MSGLSQALRARVARRRKRARDLGMGKKLAAWQHER